MAPLKMSLKPQYRGDTWPGFKVESILINGALPTVNAASCRMQFRDKMRTFGFELTTETSTCKGSITIDDPVTWEMTIEEIVLPLDVGTWWWDLEVTDVNNKVVTILAGRIRITEDITIK